MQTCCARICAHTHTTYPPLVFICILLMRMQAYGTALKALSTHRGRTVERHEILNIESGMLTILELLVEQERQV